MSRDFPASSGDSTGSRPDEEMSPAYDADGVDRSLIRWMLRLSPAERLAYAQGVIDMVKSVQRPANGDR